MPSCTDRVGKDVDAEDPTMGAFSVAIGCWIGGESLPVNCQLRTFFSLFRSLTFVYLPSGNDLEPMNMLVELENWLSPGLDW